MSTPPPRRKLEGYNSQLTVTSDQIIAAVQIGQSLNDLASLVPMMETSGRVAAMLHTDTGRSEHPWHRHAGIGLHTLADVHFGLAAAEAADRRSVLAAVREQHPYRFGITVAPKILDLPDSVLFNRPVDACEDTQD
ncbi:hypothetical protein LQL77_31945 [Rhodococcus cerastii]|nr:hypothetical protein [Rhodococcus cerastii]